MITCPIPLTCEQLDLASDTLRQAIVHEMNIATNLRDAETSGRLSDSAIQKAMAKSETHQEALLALLDHLNSFHFQDGRALTRKFSGKEATTAALKLGELQGGHALRHG